MRRKNKKFYIVLILIVLFGVSVGYAAISRILTINGSSEVKQNTWDIHFENIQIKNGSVTATKEPTLENSNTSVNFSFMLDLPGDYYEFTVDAVNKGTIDAMIESITKTPELTAEQAKYLNYIIEYQNGEEILSNQIVLKESFVRIKVRVEYRSDLSENDLPTTFENLNLGFALNCVQADYNIGTVIKYNGIMSVDGDINDIGTVVTIGSEKFYTIGTEGENVKLLAMYNLYVGSSYNSNTKVWTEYGDSATGLQHPDMKGSDHSTVRNGIVIFSSDTQKGTKYSDYKGSIVEPYVNRYKTEIEWFGIDVVEARLINIDELTDSNTFGCVANYNCSSSYPWLTSTSYWSGSSYNDDIVWVIINGGVLGYNHYFYNYFGIRPVIVISKDYF